MEYISWDDFQKIDFRVGTIVEAEEFSQAQKPALKLKIDFGSDIGIKKSSAQITGLYTPAKLIGKQIIAVINFKPKQIGPFMSECLVTGFHNKEGAIVLATPELEIHNGARLA